MKLKVLDQVSDPGAPGRPNEDTLGATDYAAFVIDGATGLGDEQYMTGAASDAAWLANFAADYLLANSAAEKNAPAIVAACIANAKTQFESATNGQRIDRYAWPSASFAMLRVNPNDIAFFGLGDCSIYFTCEDRVESFSPLADYAAFENDWASRHIKKTSGFGAGQDLLSDSETLQALRSVRALQNTPQSGVWTLGLAPEAANHVVSKSLAVSAEKNILLCSDGFSALVDTYRAYTPETLLQAARSSGLKQLIAELRQIERETDPDGQRFPRFKRSDDATAMLICVESID